MTNFIYIFMIITLICIGAGIKAFNSEDSDTKTTIKNIPNGIKKVLLIGTNVQKTDITILIGTIIYLMFTIGVICIYVFASHETKVELQYKLCVAFLVMLFLETFIVVSVSYREKKTQNKAMNIHETIYISHAEKEIECDMFSKYIILSNKRWKDAKGTVYIFPATLFHEMDADGNIFRETEKGIEYLSNIGAYKSLAERCGMYYVNERWLGGMLTNFRTIESRIARLKAIETMSEDGTFDVLPKKEVIALKKEWEKLEKNLGGIKDMKRIPDAIFVVDPKKERICIKEAQALGITLIGIADTNCDPDELDYVIPGNDDAIRAVKLIVSKMADAVIEAKQGAEEEVTAEEASDETVEE